MAGRPSFKPTKAQRERVKLLKADGWSNERIARNLGIARNTLELHFAGELSDGADLKSAEILTAMEKAAKSGNVSAGKWLHERFAQARAARELENRASAPAPAEEERHEKLGKKEEKLNAAKAITGKFAPPPPPKLH